MRGLVVNCFTDARTPNCMSVSPKLALIDGMIRGQICWYQWTATCPEDNATRSAASLTFCDDAVSRVSAILLDLYLSQ